ncbi:hypothetical protein SAMN05216535_2390 [Stutzerimonas xanthomarina]|uniref:Uncharacterized protein n=3 Tax=Stutzerimonas xanthomarina TaxID=271420 RepID=A0A1M5MQI5_9GAMM|nr:hypothetical protein SAMN05216535_2390 [Stutzerimonas xanthomarina]SHG79551.1 hypothetical protein SAMN02744645_1427 [Stutzerimonas xanthomarina DSM 18231]
MVDSQEIRAAFAARLNTSLDDAPGVRKGRGRNTDLQAALKKIGVEASLQATNKWLRAESIPEKDNLRALAGWLNVRAEWLEYGVGPMLASADSLAAGVAENRPARDIAAGQVNMLAMIATPRSRQILERIAMAAAQGRLTDDDVELLDRIAARFESAPVGNAKSRAGSYQKLREKFKSND